MGRDCRIFQKNTGINENRFILSRMDRFFMQMLFPTPQNNQGVESPLFRIRSIVMTTAQIRNALPPIIPVGAGPVKGLMPVPSVNIIPAEENPFTLPWARIAGRQLPVRIER